MQLCSSLCSCASPSQQTVRLLLGASGGRSALGAGAADYLCCDCVLAGGPEKHCSRRASVCQHTAPLLWRQVLPHVLSPRVLHNFVGVFGALSFQTMVGISNKESVSSRATMVTSPLLAMQS
eukprot:1156964-Pelagomonas_calceolata.AAC.4